MESKIFFSDIRRQIINHINNAKSEIVIAVAWFTDAYIIRSVLNKVKSGVSVWILFYDDKINKKDLYVELYNAGANIRYSKTLMHNKFCIIDRETVINGSYNWTKNAANNNMENIQISYNAKEMAYAFLEEFKKIFGLSVDYRAYVETLSVLEEELKNVLLLKKQEYGRKFIEFSQCNYYPIILKFVLPRDFRFYYDERDLRYNIIYVLIKNSNDMDAFVEETFSHILRPFYLREGEKYMDTPFLVMRMMMKNKEKLLAFINKIRKSQFEFSNDALLEFDYYYYRNPLSKYVLNNVIVGIYNMEMKYPFWTGEIDAVYCECFHVTNYNFLIHEWVYSTGYRLYKFNHEDKFVSTPPLLSQISPVGNYGSYGFYAGKVVYDENLNSIMIPKSHHPICIINQHVLVEYKCEGQIIYNVIKPDGKPVFWNSQLDVCYSSSNFNYYYKQICYCYYKVLDNNRIALIKLIERTYENIDELEKDAAEWNRVVSLVNDYYGRDYLTDAEKNIGDKLSGYEKIVYDTQKGDIVEKTTLLQPIKPKYDPLLPQDPFHTKDYGNSCYIATLVYGDVNHPKVVLLRQFRDKKLIASKYGRMFVSYYYSHSLKWVEYLRNRKRINMFIRLLLDIFIGLISDMGDIDKNKNGNQN